MAASYPTTVVVLPAHSDNTDTIFAADINTPNAEIVALETGLLNGLQHNLKPLVDDTYNLGDSSHRYLKVWSQDADIDGSLTLGGLTAHGILVGEGSSPATAISLTTGQLLVGVTGADPTPKAAATAGASLVLLKAGNGTDTSAGATTVDSIVLPVLTANDTIVVEYYCESTTQQTTTPGLYSVTDAAAILFFGSGASVSANTGFGGRVTIKQRQGNATSYVAVSQGLLLGGATREDNSAFYPATAAWTAAWTLGLHHGGVTAGGTFLWQWSVYRLAGQ